MSSLENFNCPQYVDFTSPETFELNDGADFCFEKCEVGIDLGFGNMNLNCEKTSQIKQDGEAKPDTMQQMVNHLKTMANSKPKQPLADSSVMNTKTNEPERADLKEEQTTPTLPFDKINYKHQNKENESNQANKLTKQVTPLLVKTPSTTSSSNNACNETFSVKTPTLTASRPAEEIVLTTQTKPALNATKQESVASAEKPSERKHRTPGSASTPQPPQSDSSKSKQSSQSGSNSNFLKKSLAKVTQAFKKGNAISDNLSLKSKLNSESKKQMKHSGREPLRAEPNLKRKGSNEMFGQRALSPESDHESSNRRASSVPRTLREKQALSRAGIVLESINDVHQTKHVTRDDSTRVQSTTKSEHKSLKQTKPSSGPPTSILSLASSAKKKQASSKQQQQQQQQHEERRRSRSCNESISNPKTIRHARRSTNESADQTAKQNDTGTTPKPRIAASPSSNQIKQRPKSGERGPLLPIYAGIKFMPKIHSNKYSNMEGACYVPPLLTNHAPIAQTADGATASASAVVKSLPLDDVLKQRPVCMKNRPLAATGAAANLKFDMDKKALLGNRSISGKSNSFKHAPPNSASNSNNNTSTFIPRPSSSSNSNTSLVKPSSSDFNLNSHAQARHNTSINSTSVLESTRTRKPSETRPHSAAQSNNSFLHTELRAQKRQEFDLQQKEKERLVFKLKQEQAAEKQRKDLEEIQNIRDSRTFRAKPVKHYKNTVVVPSDKPLTEPKSPHLSASTTKLTNLSMASNGDVRSFSALVDAPIRNNNSAAGGGVGGGATSTNSNLFRSNSLMRSQNQSRRNMANSHDDIRF